jgi:hypothetical protein
MNENNTEMLIYQTEDGDTKIDVRMENETVWLTQTQMAELFQTTKQNISLHINNCFKEGELNRDSVVKEYLTTAADGKRYPTKYYNLDVIISVGYRVKSLRGTQFRIWANTVLKEYLVKGFAMNDELLKKAGGGNYFDELLARIRDIRSSEKVFWRKVLDIYATSIDYSPNATQTQQFFQVVQNKMHWASHGHTASELIMLRADAKKPMMGMTSYKGSKPTLAEAKIAKNYLIEEELDTLNRIVSMYLDFAELQANSRKPMYMKDWIKKLDDFLAISERDILTGAGKISAALAAEKAEREFKKYKAMTQDELTQVERDYIASIESAEKRFLGRAGDKK